MKSYTYLIGWSCQDKWYYGVRYAKTCDPSDLWVKYFTSSEKVTVMRAKFGEPDVIQVRKCFSRSEDAVNWETKVLRRIGVLKNSKWLNASDGTAFNKSNLTADELEARAAKMRKTWTTEKRGAVSAKWTDERREKAVAMMKARVNAKWTDERRAKFENAWSPERRAEAAALTRLKWDAMTDAERDVLVEKRHAGIKASWARKRLLASGV